MGIRQWLSIESHRAYAYRVATAIGTALTITGAATNTTVTALLVVGAVLGATGSGLASVHTSTKAYPHPLHVKGK